MNPYNATIIEKMNINIEMVQTNKLTIDLKEVFDKFYQRELWFFHTRFFVKDICSDMMYIFEYLFLSCTFIFVKQLNYENVTIQGKHIFLKFCLNLNKTR